MQFTLAVLAGFAALVSADSASYTGVGATATAAAPSGCATSYPGTFQLSVANISTATKAKRQSSQPNALTISLNDGKLTDNTGRIGYIASNRQFQFNLGGQAGEIYTAGFSVCSNNTLALGGSAIWYECLSGSFYNLYDQDWAAQCQAVYLDVIPVSGTASTATATATGQSVTSAVTSTEAVVTSITDGQAQGATSASAVVSSVSVVTSVTAATTSAALVSSISDNQIQAPTTTSAIVSASTLVSTVSPVMSTSRAVISSISDNQIQAPTATTVAAYTGAAAMPTVAAQMLLAAAGAAVVLL